MARFSYCSMAYCRIFWGDCFCNSASKSTVASSSVAMSGSRLHQNQERKNTRAAGEFLITNAYEVIPRALAALSWRARDAVKQCLTFDHNAQNIYTMW